MKVNPFAGITACTLKKLFHLTKALKRYGPTPSFTTRPSIRPLKMQFRKARRHTPTPCQTERRTAFRSIKNLWKTLDAGQKTAWRTFSLAHGFLNRCGETVYLTEYQMFCRVNGPLVSFGDTYLIAAPPADLNPPPIDVNFTLSYETPPWDAVSELAALHDPPSPYGFQLWSDPGEVTPTPYTGRYSQLLYRSPGVQADFDDGPLGLTDTIGVGAFPLGIAYASSSQKMYVCNNADNTVSPIDTTDNSVDAAIPVGGGPYEALYCPLSDRVYVTNMNSGTVSVIDPNLDTVVATIVAGAQPRYMTFVAATGTIWVSDFVAFGITIIDALTNVVVTTIPFTEYPGVLCYAPNTDYVYAGYSAYEQMLVINPYTYNVDATIDLPENTGHMIYCSKTALIYACTRSTSNIVVINPANNSVVAHYNVGGQPQSIAYRPKDGYLYITTAHPTNDTVVLSPLTNGIVRRIAAVTGGYLAVADTSQDIYITGAGGNHVQVLSGVPYVPIGLFDTWRRFASRENGSCPPVFNDGFSGVYDLGRMHPKRIITGRTVNLANGVGRDVHVITSLEEP